MSRLLFFFFSVLLPVVVLVAQPSREKLESLLRDDILKVSDASLVV